MTYGLVEGDDFYLGVVGQDEVNMGGATGMLQVCLVELLSNPITNSIGFSGPSVGDGIMGLQPGCHNDDTTGYCYQNETDAISSLVKSGAISSYQFTMCYKETGGKLFLGPGQYPESTAWFPTLSFKATDKNSDNGCKFED